MARSQPASAKRFNWSNLGMRVLSAAVLAPVVLVAVWFGGWPFLLVICAALALLAREWSGMTAPQSPGRVTGAIVLAVAAAALTAHFGYYRTSWLVLVLGAGACALLSRAVAARPADAAFGALYIGAPCLALVWLRGLEPGGQLWSLLVLAVAWAADITAYVVGNALKGPKLWPQFSPNKTWSGFIGGLVAATLAAAAVAFVWGHFRPDQLSTVKALLVGGFAGLATMAGDLWESMLKRRFGVKDSGGIIPGHGGLLDRVDGLMFALLAVAAARWVVNLGWPH